MSESHKPEEATSERILKATIRLAAEKGYANVPMRDIAVAADVVLSQITYHFGSKEHLLIAAIRFVKSEYLKRLELGLKELNTTDERIKYAIDFFRNVIRNDIPISRLLLDFFNLAMWSEQYRAEYRSLFDDLASFLGHYIIRDDTLSPGSAAFTPEQVARLVIGVTFGMSMQHTVDNTNTGILDALDMVGTLLEHK